MSNCFPGAANLAASGSPTDILHPLPRPRRDLLLAHAYQHLQLAYASLSLPQLRGAPVHLTPSQTATATSSPPGNLSCGSSLPPWPAASPRPRDFQHQEKEPIELLPAPWVSVGPVQAGTGLGRLEELRSIFAPLLGRLGNCFISSSLQPCPALLTAWFQMSLTSWAISLLSLT